MDYGSTQEIPSIDVVPIKSVMESVFRQNDKSLIDDLKKVIEFPLQAICCQLKDKRDSVQNKEVLKDLIERTECFTLRMVSAVVNEALVKSPLQWQPQAPSRHCGRRCPSQPRRA